MTKKHFVDFAAKIATFQNMTVARQMAEVVISVAQKDNPRFDSARFLKACGLTPERV